MAKPPVWTRLVPLSYRDMMARLTTLRPRVQAVPPKTGTAYKLILAGAGRDGKSAFFSLNVRTPADEIKIPTIKAILRRFAISNSEWLGRDDAEETEAAGA